jgi:hypothetical protein
MLNVKCEIENVRKRVKRWVDAARSTDMINSTFNISHQAMLNLKSEIENVRMCKRPSDIINSTFHISHCPSKRLCHSRVAVTLIELLIAISIIATLSALFLGASRAAMESSRASRTKMTILKLHTLLMEQWASYETRRVDLDPAVTGEIDEKLRTGVINQTQHGNMYADLRVLALRELMKFEMPDRWTDFDLTRPAYATKQAGSRDEAAILLKSVPTIARSYYRRYMKAVAAVSDDQVDANQGAECLYMTIMLMTGDGEARTMFAAQDIGDDDGDGLPEFLDGWGRPISYLRWAPGAIARSSIVSDDSDSDHDPFDPFRRATIAVGSANQWPASNLYTNPLNSSSSPIGSYVEALRGAVIPTGGQVGFRMVPLIFSAGPDGNPDLILARGIVMSMPSGTNSGALNPYFPEDTDTTYAMGAPDPTDGDESIDNITNHLIDGR